MVSPSGEPDNKQPNASRNAVSVRQCRRPYSSNSSGTNPSPPLSCTEEKKIRSSYNRASILHFLLYLWPGWPSIDLLPWFISVVKVVWHMFKIRRRGRARIALQFVQRREEWKSKVEKNLLRDHNPPSPLSEPHASDAVELTEQREPWLLTFRLRARWLSCSGRCSASGTDSSP